MRKDISELITFIFISFGWVLITQGVFLTDPAKAWVVGGAGLMAFGAVIWFRGPAGRKNVDAP